MAQFATLYSGSSGNSTMIAENGRVVLVDMGASWLKTRRALESFGVGPEQIGAVLVTHEHSDHISGLLTFLGRFPVPVYGAPAALEFLRRQRLIPLHAATVPLLPGQDVEVCGIPVRAFSTSHDSLDCVGYRFDLNGGVAVATDLGYVSESVMDELCGCRLVALESNYDEWMLANGHYPPFLKSRIRSMAGHLCNNECAATVAMLAQSGTRRIVLMHLSEENNEPELALTTALSCLENHGVALETCTVTVAPRHVPGELIEV